MFTCSWRDAGQTRGESREEGGVRRECGRSVCVRLVRGLAGRGWRNSLEWAPATNDGSRSMRHVFGEGALRGRSPRTREGACARPPQCSGQQFSFGGGGNSADKLMVEGRRFAAAGDLRWRNSYWGCTPPGVHLRGDSGGWCISGVRNRAPTKGAPTEGFCQWKGVRVEFFCFACVSRPAVKRNSHLLPEFNRADESGPTLAGSPPQLSSGGRAFRCGNR